MENKRTRKKGYVETREGKYFNKEKEVSSVGRDWKVKKDEDGILVRGDYWQKHNFIVVKWAGGWFERWVEIKLLKKTDDKQYIQHSLSSKVGQEGIQ